MQSWKTSYSVKPHTENRFYVKILLWQTQNPRGSVTRALIKKISQGNTPQNTRVEMPG